MNLECYRSEIDCWEEELNFRNEHNPGPQNFERDLGIKIVIPEYDKKMQPKYSLASDVT